MSDYNFRETLMSSTYDEIFIKSNDNNAKIAILLGSKYIKHVFLGASKISSSYSTFIYSKNFISRSYVFDQFKVVEYNHNNKLVRMLYYKGEIFKYDVDDSIGYTKRINEMVRLYVRLSEL